MSRGKGAGARGSADRVLDLSEIQSKFIRS